jgi:hypothetical protein
VSELEVQVEEALKALRANNFDAKFVENSDAAKKVVLRSISKDAVVGVSDSATVREIGIVEELGMKGITVLNPFSRELTTDSSMTAVRDDISRKIFSCDVLVAGVNAVTEDGKLVNIDAVGNRVASMVFGPRRVLIIAGKNKIVKNADEALHRIKNVIAPFHAKTKGFATPCAHIGKCSNCNAPNRICNVISIMEKRPWRTEISVILVDEDLGLSWDETWPHERIRKITSNYEKVTWVFASAKVTSF